MYSDVTVDTGSVHDIEKRNWFEVYQLCYHLIAKNN